jgi:hypothetical protein
VNATLGLSESIVLAFLNATPPILLVLAMATGFADVLFRRLHWIFADRWRFAATGVIAILAAVFVVSVGANNPSTWAGLPALTIFEFGFLGFAVFIWPRELAIALPATPLSSVQKRNSITLWRERLFWAVLGYLAISAWNIVPVMGYHELVRLKGEKVIYHLWYSITYLSVWLLPMAAVGLVLASARLSNLARWLRTRFRFGLFASIMALLLVGQILWTWHWGVRPDYYAAADWNQAMQCWLMGHIILAISLIAITLWAMPSRAAQREGDGNRFRFA